MQQVEINETSGLPEVVEERWSVQYSGPATYVQVKGLRPGRNYAVRVVCRPIVTDSEVIVEEAPPSEILLVRTPATPPCAPALPTLSVRQRNALKYKWSEPSENGGHPILEYVVQCHPPPEGFDTQPTSEGMFEIYRGADRSVVIKKLVPGKRYSVRVKAINCIGEGPWSQVATFATQATVPSSPEMPVITSSGEDSVVLQWDPVSGNGSDVNGYQVEMDDGSGGEFTFVGHTQASQLGVSGLRSGLTYRFRVRAENAEGNSEWSPHCIAKTAATAPLAPPPPVRETASHSSVGIAWRPPEYDGGSPIIRYEVEVEPKCTMAKQHMAPGWASVYRGTDVSCTIGSLRAGSVYRVRVRAVNEQGPGQYSFPVDVPTAPAIPEAPAPPSAGARSQDTLLVQWNPPPHDGGAPIVAYKLCCRLGGPIEEPLDPENAVGLLLPEPSEASVFYTAHEGPERRMEIDGLSPGMNYEFKVCASNKIGSSSWSQVATLTTKPGLPLPPLPPSVRDGPTPKSVELKWTPPYGHGAIVNSYVVQMKTMASTLLPADDDHPPKENGNSSYYHHLSSSSHDEGHVGNGGGKFTSPPLLTEEEGDDFEGLLTTTATTSSSAPSSITASHLHEDHFTTVYHGSDFHCTVADLDPNTEYLFRIRAFNSVGASPWSDASAFTTTPACPSAPRDLRVEESSRSMLTLAWHPPCTDHGAPVTSYQLEYTLAGRGQRSVEKVSWRSGFKGNATLFVLEGLIPGQKYCGRVRAFNACGWGPWSGIVTGTTQPDVPGPPDAPTAGGKTSTAVRLSWSPPLDHNGAMVTEYELQMAQLVGGNEEGMETTPEVYSTLTKGFATDYKADKLSPGTRYAFRVRASNAIGFGPWSRLATVTTACMPPLEPTEVHAVVVDGGNGVVTVSWTTPAPAPLRSPCTSYEVEASVLRSGGGGNNSSSKALVKNICSGRSTEHKMSGLKAGEWGVRVRAIGADSAGHGGWSHPAVFSVVGSGNTLTLRSNDSSNSLCSIGGGDKASAGGVHHLTTGSVGGDEHAKSGLSRSSMRGQLSLKTAVAKKVKRRSHWYHPAKLAGISEETFKDAIIAALLLAICVGVFLLFASSSSSGKRPLIPAPLPPPMPMY